MTVTDRLSLLQYEHLSLGGTAAAQFTLSLDALRALSLAERYEHPAALYLGDIADVDNRDELLGAKHLALGFAHGLIVAKVISEAKGEALRQVFQDAAERAIKDLADQA
ncbi:hypothetical protein [Pseudomonas cremoricolorata]|uniref:Uncharacterized protein n=1 Tax=Pseudomonas cremoricolorata TaxID=157783 RepID=A0A089WP69_9PSED|nr:hypothetical protein [Pseudomonas cremoricolorata]AIR91090.1 hypothetical protein LK03_18255 [Pseudomonas cremoricolorata]